jgi:hypothetical protein
MLGGRSWDEWIAQYSGSHQHPVNRREERAHRASASGSSTRMGVDSGNTGPPPATSTSAKQATNRRPRAGRGARKPSPSRFASTIAVGRPVVARDAAHLGLARHDALAPDAPLQRPILLGLHRDRATVEKVTSATTARVVHRRLSPW